MRICFVCADSGVSLAKHNGSAAHVRAIAGAFRELGHEVELLLAATEGAASLGLPVRAIPRPSFARALAPLVGADAERPGDPATASLRALRRLWINPGLERSLDSAIRRFRPDLVYERHSPFVAAGPIVARRRRVPHLLEVNAPLAWEGSRHREQALAAEAELLERAAFAASPAIVAVSDELRDQLVEFGVAAGKIRVVPNAVDVRRFDGSRPGSAVPARPELDGKLVVGFVGSLKPWHGVETLAAAFDRLAGERPDLHLLVVGDGPLGHRIAELRDRLPGRVTWTGAVPSDEVPALLAATHVAVAPYPGLERFYYSPLKVLEYMAAGNAVVASRIGQIPRLLADGESGLLVPPGDADALAAAIARLAADAALRRRLGARARDEARRRHTWTQRATEILELARAAAA